MISRIPRRGLTPSRSPLSSSASSVISSSSIRKSSTSTSSPHLANKPFRIAIVGGGPAGFYAASRLLSLPGSEKIKVDLFELLPTPFGLARYGVAPDHPEVKVSEKKPLSLILEKDFGFFFWQIFPVCFSLSLRFRIVNINLKKLLEIQGLGISETFKFAVTTIHHHHQHPPLLLLPLLLLQVLRSYQTFPLHL